MFYVSMYVCMLLNKYYLHQILFIKVFCQAAWLIVVAQAFHYLFTEVPEEMTKLAMQEKLISFKRVGDAFEMINLLGDLEFKATVKLNESCDWKEKDEDPKFIFKVSSHPFLFIYLFIYCPSCMISEKTGR